MKSGLKIGLLIVCLLAVVAAARNLKSTPVEDRSLGPALTHRVAIGNLSVTVIEQGTLESAENTEIKCKVRGENTIIWVVEPGTLVREGDELMRLDTLAIEDSINERSKYALWSRSGAEQAGATARRAKLAIKEYLEGRYIVQKKTLEKDLAVAEQNLNTAENMLRHAQRMLKRGYTSQLEVEENTYAYQQARLAVNVKKTEIEVLTNFTRRQELERLTGDWKAAKANQASLEERAKMDGTRRDIAIAEKEHCVIRAPKGGMVILPIAKPWEKTPEIEEGATVHRNQTLLLMPDLENMQVKVGVHESLVDRMSPGLQAKITLPDLELDGQVSSIASVAQPAGWWTGNVVKYDTTVALPNVSGLRPGMSAEVEIVLAEHKNVIAVPVAAVLETQEENLCWVKTETGFERRVVELGDSNDVYIMIKNGLEVGEDVVLNPRGSIQEAQDESLKTIDETENDQDSASDEDLSQGEEKTGQELSQTMNSNEPEQNAKPNAPENATSSETEAPNDESTEKGPTDSPHPEPKQSTTETKPI